MSENIFFENFFQKKSKFGNYLYLFTPDCVGDVLVFADGILDSLIGFVDATSSSSAFSDNGGGSRDGFGATGGGPGFAAVIDDEDVFKIETEAVGGSAATDFEANGFGIDDVPAK